MSHVKAFRCKSCGHLEPAVHAGENLVPHACSVCSEGVSFNRKGVKEFNADNWEVLADCTPERLTELGLEPAHVCKHAPVKVTDPSNGMHVSVTASESLASADKA